MGKKEEGLVLLVLILSLVIPISNAYQGNSSSYNVVITDFGVAGFEETTSPNESTEFFMGQNPDSNGTSDNYNVTLGLPKLLGPIAFNISLSPNMARNSSIINCTGINAFSDSKIEMPKHLYKFTDGVSVINTDWDESGLLDCLSVGGCSEPNITCHFKVDDSHMNSTEIVKTIIVDTHNPIITLISPLNDTNSYTNQTWTFLYNISDEHIVLSCKLIINDETVQSTNLPLQNTTLNFTYYLTKDIFKWSVNCTDEAENEGRSEDWILKTYNESMNIENIGITGFENISANYTNSREVMVKVNYSFNANNCRLKNENLTWSNWDTCQPAMHWFLSEGDGLKTVYMEINHTANIITNFSDTIILESNASHLDLTAPSNFTVYNDALYTNNNYSLHFRWDAARDSEVELLNQQITYTYTLKDSNGTFISAPLSTTSLNITLTNLTIYENHTYSLVVNATNPAGLSTISESNGTTIDITAPSMLSITALPDNSSWTANNTIFFNWTAFDSLSGVAGYSMILDNINDTIADNIPETDYTNNRTYQNKTDGRYYFHIRAYDNAGNYGETLTYGEIKIDSTPPSRPVPTNTVVLASSTQIIFYWTASTDSLSGVMVYNLTITDNNTGATYSANSTEPNYTFTSATINDQYIISVTAIDYAGNSNSSETESVSALIITSARPDNNVLVAQSPIISVQTNKVATCTQDYTNKKFIYTDSKYHETKLTAESGSHPIKITCIDKDGYSASVTINYVVELSPTILAGDISIGSINDTFIGKTVNVPLMISGISQVKKDEFKVYIDNIELNDFTVLSSSDLGDYSINFIANEAGTFTIKILIGENEKTETFKVIPLNLAVEYTGATLASSKSNMIYSDVQGKKVGIASDSTDVGTSVSDDKITLNSSSDGKTYLFFTNSNLNTNTKNKELTSNSFQKTTNSFGYPQDNTYRLKASVTYDSLTMNGITEISKGTHSLFVRNLGQDKNNKTVIRIEIE